MTEYITELVFNNQTLDFIRESREEIVRCRDCVHYADHEWITSPQYGLGTDIEHVCHFWHGEPTKVEPDGFCAWGERVVD